MPVGMHSFPFQFLLPEGLPGSIAINYNSIEAEVSYKISAIMKPIKKSQVAPMVSPSNFMVKRPVSGMDQDVRV